jgi:hypothetical protein
MELLNNYLVFLLNMDSPMSLIRRFVTLALGFTIIGTIALVPAILQILSGGAFFH